MRTRSGNFVKHAIAMLLAVMMLMPAVATAQIETSPLTIRFVACPDGAGDESGPPDSGCDIPVEAPDQARFRLSADHGMGLENAATGETGVYVTQESGTFGLEGFFRDDYNYFTFSGAVDVGRWRGDVNRSKGDEIIVTYWNGPNGLIQPAENSLDVNLFTCDNGIDARETTEGCVPYTGERPEQLSVRDLYRSFEDWPEPTWEGNTLSYNGLPPYSAAQAQMQIREGLPGGYTSYEFGGDVDQVEGVNSRSHLVRNEHRSIDIYLYSPEGTIANPGYTGETRGTLNVRLASCPANTDPATDDSACETIPDDGTAQFGTIMSVYGPESLGDANADGTYSISATGEVTIWGMEPVTSTSMTSVADSYQGNAYVYYVQPGVTRTATFYYIQSEGAGTTTPAPTDEPAEAGTMRLTLATCENGLPADGEGIGDCTVIADDGRSEVFVDGTTLPLMDYPRDESGAYLIETPTGNVALTGMSSDNGWDTHAQVDEIHGANDVYTIEPGTTRDVYYFYTPPEG